MRRIAVLVLSILTLLASVGGVWAQEPNDTISVSATPQRAHPVHFSGGAPKDTFVRIYIQGPTDSGFVFRGAPSMNNDWSWSFDDTLVGEGQWKVNIDLKNSSGVWLGHFDQFTLTTTATTEIATLDLQQGVDAYTGTTDCYISDWFDGDETKAFGTLEPGTLRLRKVDRKSILIKFTTGRVPAGATVQHATFGIYAFFNTNPSGPTIYTYRLKRAWNEASATWLSPKPGQTWAAPGAMGAGVDRQAAALFTHRGDIIPGWTLFNVTDAVRAWTSGVPNHGVLLRSWDPYWASSAENSFYSSEWKEISKRPRMTIYYTVPAS